MSEGQYNKIWTYIDEAKELGYRFLYGGDRNMVTVESGDVIRQKVSKRFYIELYCIVVALKNRS